MSIGNPLVKRLVCLGLATSVVVCASVLESKPATSSISQDPQTIFDKQIRPIFSRSCNSCHSGVSAQGGLRLDQIVSVDQVKAQSSRWQLLREYVVSGHMPPAGIPKLSSAEKDLIASWIDSVLGKRASGDPGRVTIRRLNKSEYNNTVRDLLYLDAFPADEFPSDDVGYGFDNIGDVLTISPLLMEKYFTAAEKLSAQAIILPLYKETRLDAADFSEPRGSRVNGEGDRTFSTNGFMDISFDFPADGDYKLKAKAYGQQAGPEACKMQFRVQNRPLQTVSVPVTRANPAVYEIPIRVQKGRAQIAVGFVNDYYNPNDTNPRNRDRNLIIQYVEIVGPIGQIETLPESHRKLMTAYPGQQSHVVAARKVISDFAKRAFRRPVTDAEIGKLVSLYELVRDSGDPYERGIQVAFSAVLTSPSFIFRPELNRDGSPGEIGQYEMASRLSYFLWSSMPDDELFELARKGELNDTTTLEQQVDRMLKSPKARSLADDFAAQWLNLRLLESLSPDSTIFPGFNDALKADMITETKMFFLDIVNNDRSIVDFLDSKRAFVNARLARHYGLEGVNTDRFQAVMHQDPNRGGLIGQASMLTVTSNPNRTSPVKRGKWILDNLLGGAPPPPPPDTGVIEEDTKAMEESSLRKRMEVHRQDPACFSCHAVMDPMGFSLDNFDGVGKWRESDGKWPIDNSGVLPDGTEFAGSQGMRKILVSRKDGFAKVLAGKLLTFAIGRGLESADNTTVERIQQRIVQNDYRFSELVKGVVTSDAFRMRSASQ